MNAKIKISQRSGRRWMQIDEYSNALDYLERTSTFLSETDDSKWKWMPIALHGALYSFCILAVKGTNPYDPAPDGSGIMIKGRNRDQGLKLISFKEALRRVQDSNILNPPVCIKPMQEKRMDLLNDVLRNNFAHFSPKSQAIDLSGMAKILLDAMDIIEHIVIQTPALYQLDEDNKIVIERFLGVIRKQAEVLKMEINEIKNCT